MPGNPYSRFQRSNYVVTDIDRAMTFYSGVLGFEMTFLKDSDSDSYSYPVFEIDAAKPIRFAILSTADQPRVMALTEVPGPLPELPMPRRSAIVVEVGDVDAVVAATKAIGCHVYEEGELLTHDGRQGREVGLLDFDGNLVVIYHIPPAKKTLP
jgi:catechol 2,3-dioxygenase-like lactoylglutathione lyase family enzyme